MQIRYLFLALMMISCLSCSGIKKQQKDLSTDKVMPLQSIAFGSCNKQTKSQEIWEDVLANRPQLWVWLGDNIYADTKDMNELKRMYDSQKKQPEYQNLLNNCRVVGTWDDHDYGLNDGGKEFEKKDSSKIRMFEFLDVPKSNPAWNRSGVYQSYSYGPADKQVKVLLLDARYFRDEQVKDPDPDRRYLPTAQGDILGSKQWAWLEKELSQSTAQIHVIASGIQFIAEEHGFEKWANFPNAQKRLFDLFVKTKAKGIILLSGDRHIAEISKVDIPGMSYPLYDITSSGLTHTWSEKREEANKYRVGKLVIEKNFGVLKIDWTKDKPLVKVEIRGLNNERYYSHEIQY